MNITILKKAVLIFALLACLVLPVPFASAAVAGMLPEFSVFVNSVNNRQPKKVRGVYVPGTLALRVMQQIDDDMESVMRISGVAT